MSPPPGRRSRRSPPNDTVTPRPAARGPDSDTDTELAAPAGWPAPPEPAALSRAARRDRQPDRAAHRGRPGRDPHPAARRLRRRGRPRRVLPGRSDPPSRRTSSCSSSATAAEARKGSSWDHVRRLLAAVDPSIEPRILTGLSSGEGLIWAVRDPTSQDPGISDQRLLVIEPEFASVLKAASREISTLSPTLRSAWDGRPLAILTRTAPARASTAHIAVIGHITQHELRRHITSARARQRLSQPDPAHQLPPPTPAPRRRPPRSSRRHRP